MGAIVGAWRDSGQVHSEEIRAMLSTMPHRGPDGSGDLANGNVGLGHLALQLSPESSSTIPISRAGDRVLITADARIDNRSDLLPILLPDAIPAEVSDEFLLSEAYLHWGPDFPAHLIGSFSYIVWDERDQKMHCGRDPFGMRPLYYVHVPGEFFACATEIKALFALDEIDPRMSELMAALYIESITEEYERTIYERVMRVPAATRIEVGRQTFKKHKYWDLGIPPTSSGTDESFAEEFRAYFDEAVQARVRSTRPVGSQLSGGLDSSYVTCSAVAHLPKDLLPVRTYSIVFEEDSAADESRFIRKIVERPGIAPTYLTIEDKGPLDYLDWIYSVLDDGMVGGNYITQVMLLHAAKKDGCGVLLDGFDGDTTVEHGYPIFRSMANRGEWAGFYELAEKTGIPLRDSPAERQSVIGKHFPKYAFNRYGRPAIRGLAQQGRYIAAGRGVVAARRRRLTSWRDGLALLFQDGATDEATQPEVGFRLLRQEVVRDLKIKEHLEGYFTPYGTEGLGMRQRQRMLMLSGKRAKAFEISDHLSGALQMELRHPFLDLRLISFSLSLPEEQSLKNGWTRFVMRNAMSGLVPDEVTWRGDKSDMSGFFRKGLLGNNREKFMDLVSSPGLLSPYVDAASLKARLASVDDMPTEELVRLASFAISSYWLNRHFGRE